MSILLSLFWFFLVPLTIGTGITIFLQRKLHLTILQYLFGFLFMGAIFQLFAVHIIYNHGSFRTVVFRWKIVILLLFLVCLIILCTTAYKARAHYKFSFSKLFGVQDLKENPSLKIAFALIFIQLILVFTLTHIDDDDSRFIANSVVALETDTMYTYHPVTGNIMEGFVDESYKDVTSPLSIYYALLSELTAVHPAVIAHTFMPVILLLFYYTILYFIGQKLFQENLKRTGEFLILISAMNLFGCFSPFTASSFLLLRLWQGKSMVANISMPLILLCYMKLSEKVSDFFYWFLLLVTMIFSCLCSGNGIALPLILVGVCALVISIRTRKFSVLIYSGICCIPNIYYGLFYYKIISSVLWLDWVH